MKNLKYYLPHYWPIWLLLFIFWLLIKLPYRIQLWLGEKSGLLIMQLAKKSKRIAAINIELCFPELTTQEREKLLRDNFKSIGIAIFETGLGFWGSDKQLRSLCRIQGYEHIDNAQASGRGVLVVGAHFTTLEIAGRICAMDNEFAIMYRPSKIGIIDFILKKAMNKHYYKAILRHDIRGMVNLLKNHKAAWYSADVNAGRKASVFAPFFGIQAATVKAVSRFVELSDCAVVTVEHFRRTDGTGYDITVSPVLENFPTGDYVADATRINQIIEASIRKHPDQYLWQYMRFKTRPEGEKRIYKNYQLNG